MDIVTLMREKNAEYLKLVNIAKNEEENISLELNNLEFQIENTECLYAEKIEEISRNLTRDIENAINQAKDDIAGNLIALKGQKSAISEREKQRQDNIRKQYKENIEELDLSHQKKLNTLRALYLRQIKDLEEEHQTQLFVLNNSRQVSHEMGLINFEISNKESERQVKVLLDKQSKLRNEVVAELGNYEENLKNSLRYTNNISSNFQLISAIRRFYEVTSEIEALRNRYCVEASDSEAETFYAQRKAYVDTKYNADKSEIESWYQRSLQEENEKHEVEKGRILDLQSNELVSDASVEEMQASIDAEMQKKTGEIEQLSKCLVFELKREAEAKILSLQDEKENQLARLLRDKKLAIQKLESIKNKNKAAVGAFLEKSKIEMDKILAIPCDYAIGKKTDLSEIKEMPEQICIGKYITQIDECELSQALYSEKQIGYNHPVLLNIRTEGNVIINASKTDKNNNVLYRIVSGLTLKYLQGFPLNSLNIHVYDTSNDNMYFTKMSNILSKQKIVSIYNSLETALDIAQESSSTVARYLTRGVNDIYDFYKIDQSNIAKVNLIIIRNGFAKLAGNVNILEKISNLMHEVGVRGGVRFIIVNDCDNSDDLNNECMRLLAEIQKNAMVLEFYNNSVTFKDSPIEVASIAQENAEDFIEEESERYRDELQKQKKYISYEEIGFGALTVENKYSCCLSIPVGKSGAKILETQFNCGSDRDGPANSGYIAMGRNNGGKSSFFHSLIINGCMKYSPDDLQFWLLDFKHGGASSNYENANIPHIKLLSKHNAVGDAYCLFNLLMSEKERRMGMLNEVGLAFRGTTFANLTEYNKCVDNHPELGAHMSRIFVVIDEAQEMFPGSIDNDEDIKKIGDLIGKIAIQGRCVGIHMVMIVQNLSMGKAHFLKDNFVASVKGKVLFGVDESHLRESGFGSEFCDLIDEIKHLRQGESFVTCEIGVTPEKAKIALCESVDFERYFKKIREKYNQFNNNMMIIGNDSPLLSTAKTNNADITYAQLLQNPIEKVLSNRKTYSFVFGEDVYSLQPTKFLLNSEPSSVAAIGSNTRMLSSICRSLLIGADRLSHKKIYVCNGGDSNEQIFKVAIEQCSSPQESFRKYKKIEIDSLVKDVYFEYVRRKKAEEAEIIEDNPPIFVIINDIASISKIAKNCEFESLDDDNYDADDELSYDEMSLGLREIDAVKSESFDETLENRNILDVIKEICTEGAAVGVYFNFSAKNSNMYEIGEIFKETSNKLIFNNFLGDLPDANCSRYVVDSMLKGVRKEKEAEEALAVSVINGVAAKVRPILYNEEV